MGEKEVPQRVEDYVPCKTSCFNMGLPKSFCFVFKLYGASLVDYSRCIQCGLYEENETATHN